MNSTSKLASFLLLFLLGCSGTFTTRAPTDPERDDSEATADDWSSIDQPGIPSGDIDLEATWAEADTAFLSGDAATAQYHFGLVYLVDPLYRGGQVQLALQETCRFAGNDCILVMGRLDLLRIEYAETHGPRSSWVPQQETDYNSILDCYEEALSGHLDDAYATGYGVMNAPLPTFSRLARQCVDRVDAIRTQIRVLEQIVSAAELFDSTIDDFAAQYDAFYQAAAEEDWEAIVNTYPAFKVTEETMSEIVESGVLAADPARSEAVAEVVNSIEFVNEWEEENLEEYHTMRDAVRLLDDNPEYEQALIQYEAIYERIPPLLDEIETLEMAIEATSGDEQRSIERRIDANEAEIRDIRRDLRRIMVDINEIREDVGLDSCDAPYGYED